MSIAYHLVPEDWYRSQPEDRSYLPEAFEADGFVHLTHGTEQVLAAGNRYYQSDPRAYLLLTIDLDQLTAEWRYDDDSRQFPHVYGPLDRAAVTEIRPVNRAADGRFVGVGEATETPTGR